MPSHPYLLLVEDDLRFVGLVRERLAEAFAGVAVEHGASLHEAAAILDARGAPGIAIVDLNLPDGSGLDLIGRLTSARRTRVLVITAVEEPAVAMQAIRLGADGYLIKQGGPMDIAEAVEQVRAGGSPITPSVARHVLRSFRAADDAPAVTDDLPALSSRENEVLKLLTRGYRDKEIAVRLGCSPFTIASHVRRIYSKLQVRSRSELRAMSRSG